MRLSPHHRVVPVAVASAVVLSLGLVTVGAELLRTDPVGASDALPDGSTVPGRAGAEATALNLAGALGAVLLDETSTCPASRLEVSWEEPEGDYTRGAYVDPLGPPPTRSTDLANGIVLCSGSSYGFAGFTASWDGRRWTVDFVPELTEGDGDAGPSSEFDPSSLPSTRSPYAISDASTWSGRWGPEIEPLATYEPQRTCIPRAQPGVVAFRALVMEAFPNSSDSGIVRGCDIGGLSEHKEGRAWDWAVSVNRPDQRRAAEEVISWLFATDEYGNRFAMARRLGVMYVIWNSSIWNASRADQGWRPYNGRSAHTDHVHLSFSRAGGAGLTSFWKGAGISLENLGLGFVTTGLLPPEGGLGFRRTALGVPATGTAVVSLPTSPAPTGPTATQATPTEGETAADERPQETAAGPTDPPQTATSPPTAPTDVPPVTVPPVTVPPVTVPPTTVPPVTVPLPPLPPLRPLPPVPGL